MIAIWIVLGLFLIIDLLGAIKAYKVINNLLNTLQTTINKLLELEERISVLESYTDKPEVKE
jgi:hypothetical protein